MYTFNGLGMNLGNLSRISNAQTRSISAENTTGQKGMGGMAENESVHKYSRELGKGWKQSPFIKISAGETVTLAEISGSGAIQHIWMTGVHRSGIIRFYWDDSEIPSVETPASDFFASGTNEYILIDSMAVAINSTNGVNCYWEMPFRKRCRITYENRAIDELWLFYQIDYVLTEVPDDLGYFHAEFRRTNPVPYMKDYLITDSIEGKGQYVGTYLLWATKSNRWWGEGEIKFFMDNDGEYPTICGTGTEDYFCGSYCFMNKEGKYDNYSTLYTGFHTILSDNAFKSQMMFNMYRWHISDPIRFNENLKVTIQDLGWRNEDRYAPLQDDISSVCYWYQDKPCKKRTTLLGRNECEIF